MDRPLDDTVIRARRTRRVLGGLAAAAALFLALTGISSVLRPSVRLSSLRTGRVERGALLASVSASGTVVPEVEKVLASPVEARVLKVLKRPGAALTAGEPILQLDTGESRLSLDRLERDLALKENQAARAELDLEASLSTLDGQREIKKLELATRRAGAERSRKLFKEGLLSEEALKESELAAARAEVELAQLVESRRLAQKTAEAQMRGLRLERDTLGRERAEQGRLLQLATTQADRAGVLTWVISEEGAAVHRGEVLARIADLTSFRVDATVPDVNAGRLAAGQAAVVRISDARLRGTVTRVQPAVQNGLVTVSVALEERSHPLLRPNLRVDVDLVTERRESALKLPRGAFGGSAGNAEVFVLSGASLLKRTVRLGVAGSDAWEALSGVQEGDVVVLSDLTTYRHLDKIRVKGD